MAVGAAPLPLEQAGRFQVFRPSTLPVAPGDRLRITRNGRTADGKHDLRNGSIYSVRGFTKAGDLILENGWTVARDYGHLAHGYVVTSHASQGRSVQRVLTVRPSRTVR